MSKTSLPVGLLVMLVALIGLGCQPAANLPENKDVRGPPGPRGSAHEVSVLQAGQRQGDRLAVEQ